MKCAVGYCRNHAVVHLSVGPGDGEPMRYTGLSWCRAHAFMNVRNLKHRAHLTSELKAVGIDPPWLQRQKEAECRCASSYLPCPIHPKRDGAKHCLTGPCRAERCLCGCPSCNGVEKARSKEGFQ